ncbi:hypothetical protein PSR1_03881 [Anaeromyxobacter sp. PSR-1]|nr:hypothetical protein PSR1_03881 [Anaeromyxobacter sp. PSR-1]
MQAPSGGSAESVKGVTRWRSAAAASARATSGSSGTPSARVPSRVERPNGAAKVPVRGIANGHTRSRTGTAAARRPPAESRTTPAYVPGAASCGTHTSTQIAWSRPAATSSGNARRASRNQASRTGTSGSGHSPAAPSGPLGRARRTVATR